ncbi:MAG: hypothetical protein WB493_02635 [Anaeromyxobacteraceae bacterium]
MTWSTIRAVLIALSLAATGCASEPAPPAVDLTGTWSGNIESDAGPPGYEPVFGTYAATLRLVQDGGTLTGTFEGVGAFRGPVVGGVSGYDFSLTVTVDPCGPPGVPGGTVQLAGQLAAEGPGLPVLAVAYTGTPCGIGDYGKGVLALDLGP